MLAAKIAVFEFLILPSILWAKFWAFIFGFELQVRGEEVDEPPMGI